jgi:putative effector of murein hydrolase
MMAVAAYMTRALQLVLGTSKRAQDHGDSIPLTAPVLPSACSTPAESRQSTPPPIPQTPPQLRLQDHHHGQVSMTTATASAASPVVSGTTTPVQAPVPPTRAERWCAALTAQLDLAIWIVLLLFVALPVSYVAGYHTPLHLALTILAYNAANALPPPRWKTYLHPVLTSSLLTVLLIWLVAATQGSSLRSALTAYRTGAKYTALLSPSNVKAPPGAADILSTLLDASIASLALPMYHHRRSLSSHLPTLLVPNISLSVASLLAYPPLCVALGISPERSLSFASRSLTLALAQPATENLGGDGNTVAALCIISGILGVLFGQHILAFIRIPEGKRYSDDLDLEVGLQLT